jgi:hypothetical protein
VRLEDADPEYVEHELAPVVEQPEPAADALGHITFTEVADVYADCAAQAGQRGKAKEAVERVRDVLAERQVVQPVIDRLDEKARELS